MVSRGRQKSATEIGGASAFFVWRVAQNVLKNLRNAGFELPPGAPYFAFLAEFLAFLVAAEPTGSPTPIPDVDFTLTGPQGRDFSLRDQAGKLVMVFFGYTSCPDVCPATLSEMKQIRQRLGKQSEDVRFVFITVDPQRDTPERMGQYTAAFDPAIVGLTGREEQLSQVWQDYGVYRAVGESDSAGGYSVDHTARIYLIDQTGNLRPDLPLWLPGR